MAEENEETTKKQGGGFLPLLLVAILALGAGAGGSYALFAGKAAPEVTPEQEAAEAEGDIKKGAADFRERLVSLEPFVVNVTDEGLQRYLKISMDLELDDAEQKEELEARKPQVRDTVIVLLTSKRLSDVATFEGKALLKEELLDRVNAVLQIARVRTVLFTEFVVQ